MDMETINVHCKTLAAAIREPEDGWLALAAAVFGPTAERPSWHDALRWEDVVALPSGMLSGFVAGMTAGQRKAAIRERRHAHDKIDNRAA